jgi:hypothetical protein
MTAKSYKAFYITSVIVALINLANLNKFNVPPGMPILVTGIAIAYCLLVPRINLLTASLVWIFLTVLIAIMLPVAQLSTSKTMQLTVAISGMLIYSLAAPMLLGLAAHGISVLLRRRRLTGQQTVNSVSKERPIAKLFREAVRLDRKGEWEQAAAICDRIAERIPGQQDGDYARNLAREIREKMARARGA